MHRVDEGAGPPVLLLHGEPTWSYLYRSMIPILTDVRRNAARRSAATASASTTARFASAILASNSLSSGISSSHSPDPPFPSSEPSACVHSIVQPIHES